MPHDLTSHTTLKLPFFAQSVFELKNKQDFPQLSTLLPQFERYFILGGGANTVAAPFFKGLIIQMALKGKAFFQDETDFFLNIHAGENWAEMVTWAHHKQIFGLENLAGIPGQVGGAVAQNIGAYGVEIQKFVFQVKTLNLKTFETRSFSKNECGFSYRNSIFKNPDNPFLITETIFKIPKKGKMQTDYAGLKNIFLNETPTPPKILNWVLKTRAAKLPAPQILPNVGSFFKNPKIKKSAFEKLKKDFPHLPFWQEGEDFKISAAFLIEEAGLKGIKNKRETLGIFPQHALILVHYQNATRAELDDFTKFIQQNVLQRFDIFLETEPVFVPQD